MIYKNSQNLKAVPIEFLKPNSILCEVSRLQPRLLNLSKLDLWPLLGVQQLELNVTQAKFLILQSGPLSLTPLSLAACVRNLEIT